MIKSCFYKDRPAIAVKCDIFSAAVPAGRWGEVGFL